MHWASYACWPLAMVHGLGTGSDGKSPVILGITVLCVVSVAAAGAWRLNSGWPDNAGLRVAAGSLGAVALVAGAAWTMPGPLRAGWSARAGTPAPLVAGANGTVAPTSDAAASTLPPFPLTAATKIAPYVTGRGACGHPDGTVRLITSAMAVFAPDVRASGPRPLPGNSARAAAASPGRIDPHREASMGKNDKAQRLRVNPLACYANGVCLEALPEMIGKNPWGHLILSDQPVPGRLLQHARRAVATCPTLALKLADADHDPPMTGGDIRDA